MKTEQKMDMQRKKCLAPLVPRVYESFFNQTIMEELAEFTDLRVEVERPWKRERFAGLLREHQPEIVITGWESPMFESQKTGSNASVKLLVHTAGGVRKIVDRGFIEKGGLVTNWGHTMAPSVAEGVLMMTLASLRRMPHYHEMMHHEKKWKVMGGEHWEGLFGRSVGLHGFGRIARSFLELIKPFGCKVSAYSPHVPDALLEEFSVSRCDSLNKLYSSNHVIINLAADTPENFHIVDRKILSLMQDGAHLVLAGRGGTVDTGALVEELRSGRIFAAVDVYEMEPLPEDSPLRGLRNCLLIPHLAGPTPDRYQEMGRLAVQNIRNYLTGKPLSNLVSASQYDWMT